MTTPPVLRPIHKRVLRPGFKLLCLAGLLFARRWCGDGARIGLDDGSWLSGKYSRALSEMGAFTCTALLFMANTFNIGQTWGPWLKQPTRCPHKPVSVSW